MTHRQSTLSSFLSVLAGLALFCLALPASLNAAVPDEPFDAGRTSFAVLYDGEVIPYEVFGLFVVPGDEVPLEIVAPRAESDFALVAEDGTVRRRSDHAWTWTAPDDPGGLTTLEVVRRGSGPGHERMRLNVFLLVPLSEKEGNRLNGYRIGNYPSDVFRGLDAYRKPYGLAEITPENRDTKVSPHFTVGQFLCKQADGFPKYLILRERMLRNLEFLLREVNDAGIRADTFFVMSGFRTPWYNKSIGNVKYSRHQWGGATDIFIDRRPADGVMDDLDRDGRVTREDGRFLFQLFERLSNQKQGRPFMGGLGLYGITASHGPFVHVDVRGYRARWGE